MHTLPHHTLGYLNGTNYSRIPNEKTYRDGVLVLERWSLKPADIVVLSSSDDSKWTDGSVVNGVDVLAVSHDLTNRTTRIPQEHVTIPMCIQ